MTSGTIVGTLRRVALFQGLESAQIKKIARIVENVSFRTGDTIITEGEAGTAAFVIVSGSCQRTNGRGGDSAEDSVASGSLIGEMAMLIEINHASSIACKGPVQALKIARAAVHDLMTADPDLAEHFVAKITSRLHDVATELRRFNEILSATPQPRRPVVLALPPPSSGAFPAEAPR
jgi:CRP-like cAMP-binding protein